MKLSAVPWDQLREGQRVQSHVTSRYGRITLLVHNNPNVSDDNEIEIHWENGHISYAWHFWMDRVTVIDPIKGGGDHE